MGDRKATKAKNTTVTQQSSSAISPRSSLPAARAHPLLQLQRQIGNQAVTKLIQAKLKVGKPNDTYEQEADRVADTVMRMPDPIQRQAEEKKEETAQAKSAVGQISPFLQRQTEEKKEESAQTTTIGPITPLIQRQATEEKKEETVQKQVTEEKKEETAQRQATEEKKEETVQRQATEEKKEETVQKQATEEKKEETAQRQATEEKKEETVQKQATEEKKEETVQKQATEEKKEETVQAKGVADAPEVTSHLETRIQTMRGGGQPLPETTRTFFESRFGYDLGGVRVHTDSQADEASRSLNAQAFTIGQNVFFAGGRYEPHTAQGKWLLAHELTHTLQQQPPKLLAAAPNAQTHTINRKSAKVGLKRNLGNSSSDRPVKVSVANQGHIARKITAPTQDPGFRAVVERIKGTAKQMRQHAPAKTKSTEAQAAAKGPANEVSSKAAANQVQQMDRQQPKPFDRNAFKKALLAKIAAAAPKTLEEADKFKESGKLTNVKGDLTGQVDTSKKQSQGNIESTVKAAPSTSGVDAKPVTPLPPAEKALPPTDVNAAQAAPKPKTADEVSLQAGSQSIDQKMADAKVTDEQLKKSNEPDFQAAADAKKQAQADAVKAPQAFRQGEKAVINQAQTQATTTAQSQLTTMQGVKGRSSSQLSNAQQEAQKKDEQELARFASEVAQIYDQTKKKAEDRLSRLDTEVNQAFDSGAGDAQKAFEDYVDRRMEDYKDKRYGGIDGPLLWLKDKFLGLPSEVNVFYEEGRKLYIAKMDAVLDKVSMLVEKGLTEAKAEITGGRAAVQEKVNKLSPNLKQKAQQDIQKFQSQFDELEQSVNDKQNQLIDSLAQKYNEKLKAIDDRIAEMKANNRGLVDAALDAVGGVIDTILELKNMLLNVLSRAAAAIDKVIKDPIGFLGNLVAGVKQGFMNFVGNIATHLQKGLMGWLFGAMAEAGIQLPDSFDLKGILSIVLQVLGLTYANIRARAVKILGEKVVKALETVAEIFIILVTKGPAGLWEYIKEQLSNLKEVVVDGIKSFVAESIIKAGVTWIIGLLNPAGAFIKACKAIYDIIMFFVERGSQIMALVNAVIDSVTAIASGAIGAAASFVENALSKAVPVVISFLAALLGVTGITEKIRTIIAKIQAPVNKAIDWVINKAYNLVKAAGKLLGFGKGKEEGKPKVTTEEAVVSGDPETRSQAGLDELDQKLSASASKDGLTHEEEASIVTAVKSKYGFNVLEVRPAGDEVILHGEMSPGKDKKKNLRDLRVKATSSESRLIENPSSRFPREQAMAVDEAQVVMNDLYREKAEYGDGSTAFMAMKEQFEGGVGRPPRSLKGGTLHATKCRQYITGLQRPRTNLPKEAQQRIDAEIRKMQEALAWADNYHNGNDPSIPGWARPWKGQLGK